MTQVDRFLTAAGRAERAELLGLGVGFLLEGARSEGRFALVEHPLAPRALGAPLHAHSREDEYSFVLEGRFGIQIGDSVFDAGPGDLAFKPRGVPHAFWNPDDAPARLLEIISPAGFEAYFREMAPILSATPPDFARAAEICAHYGIDMDFASAPDLIARYGLIGPG